MPQINKTTLKEKSKPKTGMLAKGIDVEDLVEDFIKMVIYGQNRTGKTTLACTFPKPLALVAFEPAMSGGATSVKKIPGIKLYRVRTPDEAIQLAKELRGDDYFNSVVMDSVTSLQDIVLKEILGLEDVPVQLGWGSVTDKQYQMRSEQTKEITRLFVDLPKHTVITAKEKDHNPPKGDRTPKLVRGMQIESFFSADVGSATASWIQDACDYIGRLYLDKETIIKKKTYKIAGKETTTEEEVETGKIVHRLRTLYHPNFAAGFRSCNPESIPEHIDDPTFAKIHALIKGD